MRLLKPQTYYLLWELVIADFKLRYQGSVFGYLWSLGRPLALFTILYFVFVHFFKFGQTIPHYPVYLLLGIVIWNFFIEATNTGMRSIVDRGELIRKVSIPKFIIVVAPTASAFVNLLLNFVVVFVFAAIAQTQIQWSAIIFMPLLLIELLALTIAVTFLLSALFVKFRDMAYIWELGTQLMFYATPILYPLNIVPAAYAKLLLLNPMAQIIQDARFLLVTSQTQAPFNTLPLWAALVPLAITAILGLLAAAYFRKQSRYFAEDI